MKGRLATPLILLTLGLGWLAGAFAQDEARYGHDPAADRALSSALVVTPNSITIAVPGSIFASLRNGKPVGVIAEAVDQVLFSMGYHIDYVSMPSRDMRHAVQDGTVDVATSLLTPKNRTEGALYTDPVINEYNVLLVRRGEFRAIKSISDLHGREFGARVGYKYPLIENEPGIRLQRNRQDGENVRKLLLHELDAVIVAGVADLYEFRAEGIMSEVEILEKAVGVIGLGAALADERFTPAQVDEFNRRMTALKASPMWQQILDRNGMLDLVREWPLLEHGHAEHKAR